MRGIFGTSDNQVYEDYCREQTKNQPSGRSSGEPEGSELVPDLCRSQNSILVTNNQLTASYFVNKPTKFIFDGGDATRIEIDFEDKTIRVKGDWDDAAKFFIERVKHHMGWK